MYKKISILFLLTILNSCPRAIGGIPNPISEMPNLTSNPNIFLKAESVSLPFDKLGMSINSESSQNLVANVKLSDGSTETNVEWLSSDTSVATINKYGNIKSLKSGTSIITARSPRDYNKASKFSLVVYNDNIFPKWSSSNDKIGFISNRDGKLNLYSMNPDGTNQKKISDNPGIYFNNKYQWSSQGDKVVYASVTEASGNLTSTINVSDLNGQIQTFSGSNISPNSFMWSNDNSKIAFVSYRGDSSSGGHTVDLYTVNSDGSNLLKITNGVNSVSSLSWSPDSKKIAYTSNESNLNVFDFNSNKNNYITSGKYFSWLADSSKLIYVPALPEFPDNDYDLTSSIFKVNADGTNKEIFLENNGLAYSDMVLSPDKTKIILIGSKQLSTLNPSHKLQDIFTISIDGKNFKNLTNNSFNTFSMTGPTLVDKPGLVPPPDITYQYPRIRYDAAPIWSPDSKYIAIPATSNIQSNGVGFQELDIISTENDKVTSHDIFSQDGDPNKNLSWTSDSSWSSDSSKIIFTSNKSKQENINKINVREIYSLDINSSKITRLTNNNSINSNK